MFQWLKTRKKLKAENEQLLTKLAMLRHLIKTCPSIEEMKALGEGLADPFDEVHMSKEEGLEARGWVISFIFSALSEMLDKFEGADNYLEIEMGGCWKGLTLLIQKNGHLTPAQKATQLQGERDILKERLARLESQLYKGA